MAPKRATTTVQSIIFEKGTWTKKRAKEWLKKHDYKHGKVDTTENFYRYRQIDPKKFNKKSFRTIVFGKGIEAVIGKTK